MGMSGIHVAAALACATAVLACCAAAPAHALELYDLSAYAEYSPETGTIRLTPFNVAPSPGVDWSSIDPGKMRLVGCAADGGCAEVPMSVRVVIDVFGDNLLELSTDGGPDVLAGAASLTLTIEEGAYRKADGGAANVPLSVPVVMPGEYPAHLLEGAAYDHRTDHLSLFFADAVDASSVDWDRIYLYGQPLIGRLGFDVVPEPALVPMPEPDLVVGSREDGRVAVFALGADARNALLSVAFPALYANTGAYRGADGTVGHAGFGKIEVHEDAYRERFAGLVSVEYLVGKDRLHIRFIGAVDPLSVDPDRMFIGMANIADSGPEPFALIGAVDPLSVDPDRMFIGMANIADSGPEPSALIPCSKQSVYQHIPGITVSPSEFVGVSEDGKTVILNLSESNRYRLSTMPDPQLTVHDGALRWLEDGTEFVADAAPVEITGGDFFPPNPDIPAGLLADSGYEDYGRDLLSHASLKTNAKMYVYFTEPIDTSAMDLGRIHLVGCAGEDCTFIPLADQQIIDGGDGTSIAITLPLGGGAILQSETRLSLVIEGGAYSRQGDGSPNAPERTAAKLPDEFYPQVLGSAEYDPDRNELAMYFTEAINPSSIHSSRISMVGEGLQDLFTLSGLEPARVAGDGTYVVFELNSQDQAKLRTTEHPAVITHTGAFERASDRMAVGGDIKNLETAVKADPTDGIEDILLVNYDYYKREDNRVAMLTDGASTKFGASACYTTGDNTLTLDLGERIDRFSIDVSRIHIYDDSKIISMSVQEFVGVDDDGRSMFFELSPHNRYVLSFMTEPSSVLLEPGAFRSPAGVTESGVRRVPLDVSGEAVFLLDPTVPAGVLLGRAEYSLAHGTAELVLHFRESIDPSSMNTDLITIVNDGCSGIALSELEIVSVGEDKKSLVFGIDVNDALALWDMRSAWVRLEQGGFCDRC